MGSYRYLMTYTALFEMIYSIVDVLVTPKVFSHGSMFFVIVSTKNSAFSKDTLLSLVSSWCGFFGGFMVLFCIQFIYRYLVVIGSNAIKSFNDYRIVFWILIPIISTTVWGSISRFLAGPRSQLNDILRDLLLIKTDYIFDEITYVGPQCYYKTADGNSVTDIDSIIALTYMMIVMTLSLFCITFLAMKTFMKIRNTLTPSMMTSNKYNRLQWQTFYALVTQTLIPVILMHLPCIMIISAAMLDIDLGHSSGIASITFAMFPALDPLPVMLIIKNYRETLWSVMAYFANIFVRRKSPLNEQSDPGTVL